MLPPENTTKALELINLISGYYKNVRDQFTEDDQYYDGDLDNLVEVPEGFEVSIPTTARAIIDEAVDNIEPYEIQINYPARGFGKKAQEEAETISRALNHIWQYWRSSNSDIDILRDFIKNLFKNGKAVFKVVPEWSLWPTLSEAEEAKLMGEGGKAKVKERALMIKNLRDQSFPIICRSLSPRHIMEDPSMDSRKLWCIEEYIMSNEEVRNKFTQFVPQFEDTVSVNWTIQELWTATWVDWNGVIHEGRHWVFINQVPLNNFEDPRKYTVTDGEPNPYHNIPYIIKHSGFGTETYDGQPEKKAVGFFTKQVKSQLKAEMRRVTAFDALMQQLAYPLVLLPDTLEDIEFDTGPGGINYVPMELLEQAKNIFLSAPLPQAEYQQSINMIQNQIERGTTQRAIRGAGVPGTDSAAQLSMITSQAKLRLEPIKKATEEAVDMVNAMVLFYIENILKDSVSVFGAEKGSADNYIVKPETIRGKYRTKTTFMPNEDQVKERKLMVATDAMSKAKLNPYDAYLIAGYENPMEMIARNMAYELMQEPSIKRQLSKKVLLDWGLDAKEVILEEMADENMIQQMMAQLQQKLQGTQPPGPVGPQPNGQGQGQPSVPPQPAPQVIGAPVQMPQQMQRPMPQMPQGAGPIG